VFSGPKLSLRHAVLASESPSYRFAPLVALLDSDL